VNPDIVVSYLALAATQEKILPAFWFLDEPSLQSDPAKPTVAANTGLRLQ